MFYAGELESEIRRLSHQERLQQWRFFRDEDREKYLEMVIEDSNKKRYQHEPSDPGCSSRGEFFKVVIYCTFVIIKI